MAHIDPEAIARDAAGNWSAAVNVTLNVLDVADTAAPDTVIDTGPSGATNNASPSFTFHSTEAGSTFECSLDGGAFVAPTPDSEAGPSTAFTTIVSGSAPGCVSSPTHKATRFRCN